MASEILITGCTDTLMVSDLIKMGAGRTYHITCNDNGRSEAVEIQGFNHSRGKGKKLKPWEKSKFNQ
jgi:hypothetical protein